MILINSISATNSVGHLSGSLNALFTNYNVLTNKPSINGVDLVGDLTLVDIGVPDGGSAVLDTLTNLEIENLINSFQ